MTWLTPAIGLTAAAVAIPLLVLLYFLKLKRIEQVVPSTLLWKRAVQDLQVNAPFQRIRRNLLLLLQLLALTAVLTALAGPVVAWQGTKGHRYVVLIDRSASMNAIEAQGRSRLDMAKDQAKAFVESVRAQAVFGLGHGGDQVMVVAFDDRPKVLCNFTADKPKIHAAIDQVSATDQGSSLAEAITVARAFAQSPGQETNNRSSEQLAQLILFSDGGISDLAKISVGPDEVQYHPIGQVTDNLAITAMQAKRSYDDPGKVQVFAALAQYGPEPATVDMQVSVDANVVAVRSVTVPGSKPSGDANQVEPGKAALDLTIDLVDQAVVEVRILRDDGLASDNAAWCVVPAPRQLKVCLVTEGNPVLASVLKACTGVALSEYTPAQFDVCEPSMRHDVIVVDHGPVRCTAKAGYLVFGQIPEGLDVAKGEAVQNQYLVDWRSQHSVLRYVNLENLFVAEGQALVLPKDGQVLAEFSQGTAMGVVRRGGSVFLCVGFEVLKSNWPFEPGFVLFCMNALEFLGTQTVGTQTLNLGAGDPIVLEGLGPGAKANLAGPAESGTEVTADSSGQVRVATTARAGVYRISVPGQAGREFAVNACTSPDSDIKCRPDLAFSGQAVQGADLGAGRANWPIWPVLVLGALILACVEWWVYNSKVRI